MTTNKRSSLVERTQYLVPKGLEGRVHHTTNYLETVVHVVKGNLGAGLFAMGDAMKNGGLVLAPPGILLIGGICIYNQHLLRHCDYIYNDNTIWLLCRLRHYCVSILEDAGGGTGGPAAGAAVPAVHAAAGVRGQPDQHPQAAGPGLRPGPRLPPLRLGGAGGTLRPQPASGPRRPHPAHRPAPTVAALRRHRHLHLRGHRSVWTQVLPLRNEMREPERFDQPLGPLNVGILFCVVAYLSLGPLTYLQYGLEVESPTTINLPSDPLSESVRVAVGLGILLTYPIQFYVPVKQVLAEVTRRRGPVHRPLLLELVVRGLLVLATYGVALAVPYVGLVVSLLGAVCSNLLALLFPALASLALRLGPTPVPSSGCRLAMDLLSLLLSVLGMGFGCYVSLIDLYLAISRDLHS